MRVKLSAQGTVLVFLVPATSRSMIPVSLTITLVVLSPAHVYVLAMRLVLSMDVQNLATNNDFRPAILVISAKSAGNSEQVLWHSDCSIMRRPL